MNSNFRGRDFCIQQVNEAKFKHFERYYAAPENDRGLNLFFGIVFASQNIWMWSQKASKWQHSLEAGRIYKH